MSSPWKAEKAPNGSWWVINTETGECVPTSAASKAATVRRLNQRSRKKTCRKKG